MDALITGGAGFEDMRARRPDVSKMRDTFGWRPEIPLEDTLDEVIASTRKRMGG